MPNVLETKTVRRIDIPLCTIFRQQSIKGHPINANHLEDTELYPLCNEVFLTQPEKSEHEIKFVFPSAFGVVENAVRKTLGDIKHKTEHERNHTNFIVRITGLDQIEKAFNTFAAAEYGFNSSYGQLKSPYINQDMQRAVSSEIGRLKAEAKL